MLNRSTKYKSKDTVAQKPANFTSRKSSNHGLGVPNESLVHITSYLDPPSLFALSRVNSTFLGHVQDDHTWHMAFNQNFLGIDPQGNPTESKSIVLFRRSEPSWKREYVVRFNIRRRWEKSRATTITHVPLHSPIYQIHLLSPTALLSASLQYGIVSRSLPLTGKILRGYLSPSPAGTGLGIGNPNTEFAPNVTACSIFSEGSTAKIAWGLRSGEVAVMSAIKVSDSGNKRTPAKLSRCKVDEEHQAEVLCTAWDDSGLVFVSGARDGSVKIWDAVNTKCLWTANNRQEEAVGPFDPCKIVVSAVGQGVGVVAAGLESGDILVWYGFDGILDEEPMRAPSTISDQIKIPCPCPPTPSQGLLHHVPEISAIHVDVLGKTVALLLAYKSQTEFYQVCINTLGADGDARVTVIKFSNPTAPGCPITALQPHFTDKAENTAFVLTGDLLGTVSVYPWVIPSLSLSASAAIQEQAITPTTSFEAHEDNSAVTALAWNGITLITGSAKGTSTVFDGLTFECLRTFASPVSRPRGGLHLIHGAAVGGGGGVIGIGAEDSPQAVKQILLDHFSDERDLVVIAVGDKVMAWKAGLVPKNKSSKKTKRSLSSSSGFGKTRSKGFEQIDLKQRISDSISYLNDESSRSKRIYKQHREQLEGLASLGLDEVEAVEYVLMLSRDEALARENERAGEEGVFEGDFGDDQDASPSGRGEEDEGDNDNDNDTATESGRSQSSSSSKSDSQSQTSSVSFSVSGSSSPSPSPPSYMSTPASGTGSGGVLPARIIPRPTPSSSNNKVQVSPPFREEAREAGPIWTSSSMSPEASPWRYGYASPLSASASASPRAGPSTGAPVAWPAMGKVNTPPVNSAWAKPLRFAGTTSSLGSGSGSFAAAVGVTGSGVGNGGAVMRGTTRGEIDEDADLRLAIELSLAEANSLSVV